MVFYTVRPMSKFVSLYYCERFKGKTAVMQDTYIKDIKGRSIKISNILLSAPATPKRIYALYPVLNDTRSDTPFCSLTEGNNYINKMLPNGFEKLQYMLVCINYEPPDNSINMVIDYEIIEDPPVPKNLIDL